MTNVLLETVASNCLVAAALATVVAIVAKCRANPTLVHFLLLLVLIKLFTPPLVSVGIPESVRLQVDEPVETVFVGYEASARAPTTTEPQRLQSIAEYWQAFVLTVWAAGIVDIIGVTAFRIITFQILLRRAGQAPPFLSVIVTNLCRKMGVRNVPEILLLPVRITPAVWSLTGRPRIIFPQKLITEMSRERLETIIAHELAHIRRKDHLVRFLEFAATTVFWWNPIVWWVRRQLRELEERCCDAIVLETVTNGARDYAIALVETLEFLSQDHGRLPIGATAAKPTVSLSRRIEMLKSGTSARQVTTRSMILTACLLAAPMGITLAAEPPSSSELTTKLYNLGPLKSEAQQIEQQIVNEVGSKQWKQHGGPFTIRRTANGDLIVNATAAVHQQILRVLRIRDFERQFISRDPARRQRRFIDVLKQVESEHIEYPQPDVSAFSDEPPIDYPPPEIWETLKNRREKSRSIDLSEGLGGGGGGQGGGFGDGGGSRPIRPIPVIVITPKDAEGRDLTLRLLNTVLERLGVGERLRIEARSVGNKLEIRVLPVTDNGENDDEEADESR